MSWIGATVLVTVILVFAALALIASYSRGYREGFTEGEESGRLLNSLEELDPVEEEK